MYAFVVLAVHLFLIWVMTGLTTDNMEVFKEYREITRDNDLVTLRDDFAQYWQEKHTLPGSLAAMKATQGFEHVTTAINTSVGYQESSSLTDTKWQFNRAILYSYNAAGTKTLATRLGENGCTTSSSTSNFSSETGAWCGKYDWNWYVSDMRSVYTSEMANQRARQQRTMQKLASYYTANQTFPNKDQSSASLVAGTGYALSALASGPTSSTNCTDTYIWQGIPIDCEDMFDIWGGKLTYYFTSNNRISIISSTPFKNASGTNITIGTDLNLS
jgi:hypothetical protein